MLFVGAGGGSGEMRGGSAVVALGACVCALSAFGAKSERTVELFAVPLTTQVTPRGIPTQARAEVSLPAARGEVQSFYVVVRPSASVTVKATASSLKGSAGELKAERVTISRVLFVPADGKLLADAIVPLPKSGIAAKGDENFPLLVELTVPRSTRPGTYEGAVSVFADGERVGDVPVKVKVVSAEIPATASLATAFAFKGRDAWMVHDADRSELPSISQRYALSALRHRVSLVGGSGIWPMVERTEPGEGWMDVDFKTFDAEVAPLMTGESTDGAQATALGLRTPPELSAMDRFKYVLAVRKHVRERGWSNRLVLVDGRPVFAKDAPHAPDHLCECTDVQSCRAAHGGDRPWWHIRADGGPNEPSLALGTDPMKIRAIGWYAFDLNVAGIRFDDAVDGFDDVAVGGTPRKTDLYYPPNYGGSGEAWPVESVRLKLLRDGLEDYELLRQADSLRREHLRGQNGELLPKVGTDRDELLEALFDDGSQPMRTELIPPARTN